MLTNHKIVTSLLIFTFIALLVRTAWISDDAYLTLRTVDNIIHGIGPTYNSLDRVQAFTHPFWMLLLLLIYAINHDAYFSVIFLSFTLSIFTVAWIGFRFSSNWIDSLIGLGILILSEAFIDFSTSGLENPASHFLIILFIFYFLNNTEGFENKDIFVLGILSSLAILNRTDSLLLFMPALIYVILQKNRPRNFGVLLVSFLPIILWELFSVIYYGFPFPNTAYAKLNTGISSSLLIKQGGIYFLDSLEQDPITLITLFLGITLALWFGKAREKVLSLGAILYLLYIVKIGGDFMSGRFFTMPLLVSVILVLNTLKITSTITKISLASLVLLFGFSSTNANFLSVQRENAVDSMERTGITNERAMYYQTTGLLNQTKGNGLLNDYAVRRGLKLRARGYGVVEITNAGIIAYYAGPKIHILDIYALADPLLARLPVADPNHWRIGHFERTIPEGYIDSLKTRINKIEDPNLAEYYDVLTLITRGPITSRRRLTAIWMINTGQYDYLIENYLESNQEVH
jgi:arabinofuranosyltransferase